MANLKILRVGALAALVIAVAIAASGVSTASAVTLCKENKYECPVGKRYSTPEIINATLQNLTTVQFEVGESVFFKWVLEWEAWCEETSLVWKTAKNEGEVLAGTLTSASFGTCSPAGCQPEMIHIPYRTELRAEAEPNGDGWLVLKDNGVGKPAVELKKCGPLGVTCTYEQGAIPVGLDVLGGNPGELGVDEQMMLGVAGNGMACGPKLLIKTHYKVTSPKEPLFVSPEP